MAAANFHTELVTARAEARAAESRDLEDPMHAARGILVGILLSIPLWGIAMSVVLTMR